MNKIFAQAFRFVFLFGVLVATTGGALSEDSSPENTRGLITNQTLGGFILGKPRTSSIQVRRVLTSPSPQYHNWTIIPGEIGSWHLRHLLSHALAYNFDIAADDSRTGVPVGNVLPLPPEEGIEEAEPNGKEEGYIINFNNVRIVEYIRFISKISGKNFIFDDADLDFHVTIVSEEPTSIGNIMAALLQVLRIHGLSLLEQGNSILVHKNAAVRRPSKIIAENLEDDTGEESELVTQMFHLANVSPSKLATVMKPMLSSESNIEVLEETNYLIITDLATNMTKIAQVITSLDAPEATFEIGQYLVKNTAMRSLVALAEKIIAPIVQDKPFALIPHEVSSSIFIVSSPFLVKRTIAVLEILDTTEEATRTMSFQDLGDRRVGGDRAGGRARGFTPGGVVLPGQEIDEDLDFLRWAEDLPADAIERTYLSVYKLRYRKGDKIADAMEDMARRMLTAGLATGIGNVDLIGTLRGVQWVSSTNSIIFSGTRAATERVRGLIKELDAPLRQVFIEMLILDTTIDDSLTFGVEWGVRTGAPRFSMASGLNASGSSPLPAALNAVNVIARPSASTLANTAGFSSGVIGKTITHGGLGFLSLGALVKALHEDTTSNVVLNPKIITEDSVPAEIFVGTNTRFKTDSISNDEGSVLTTNYEYRDIGVRLKVTPYLSTNDVITLEIDQEYSRSTDSEGSDTSDTDETSEAALDAGPVTRKATTTTTVHIPNDYFLIISGMVFDETTRVSNRIPCLGGLPVIGGVFGFNSAKITKRNLMIFIRPHIIDTNEQIDELTERQQNIFKRKGQRVESFQYEIDTGLEFLNLKRK